MKMLGAIVFFARQYREDMDRYHAAMDEYWARKRREKVLNWLFPLRSRKSRWLYTSGMKKAPARWQRVRAHGKNQHLYYSM